MKNLIWNIIFLPINIIGIVLMLLLWLPIFIITGKKLTKPVIFIKAG